MGKGGYLGGSTVILPGGRGWSYDPLTPVSRKKKCPKPEPATTPHKADTEWLMSFAVSCAACAVLGIGFPSPSVLDKRFNLLLDSDHEKFHKPFRAKIGSSKSKARLALKEHIELAATNARLGQPAPNLPKVLRFCQMHPRFNDTIKKKVRIAVARANGQDIVPAALEGRKRKSKLTTK